MACVYGQTCFHFNQPVGFWAEQFLLRMLIHVVCRSLSRASIIVIPLRAVKLCFYRIACHLVPRLMLPINWRRMGNEIGDLFSASILPQSCCSAILLPSFYCLPFFASLKCLFTLSFSCFPSYLLRYFPFFLLPSTRWRKYLFKTMLKIRWFNGFKLNSCKLYKTYLSRCTKIFINLRWFVTQENIFHFEY
jgi:hypothetical protein